MRKKGNGEDLEAWREEERKKIGEKERMDDRGRSRKIEEEQEGKGRYEARRRSVAHARATWALPA